MSFYDPFLQKNPNLAAHKNSYRLTGMFGATASGRALPPYFILPSEASVERQSVPYEFVRNMKNVAFDLDFDPTYETHTNQDKQETVSIKRFPVSWDMNEKGSMTKELLFKYFIYVFSKFFPNSCDVDGKRVLALIDGGPGRSNLEMLAQLRVKGIYLFPSGPPNTTHVLQVMDQLFGPFKTFYQQNFELLWNYHLQLPPDHKQHGKINRTDISALIFGASLENGKELIDAFSKAFSAEQV